MHHTAAYFDATDSTTLTTQIAAVQDQILSIRNGNFFPVRNLDLLYAYAGGDGILQARLVCPTFRTVSPPNIWPLNVADQPGDDPSIADYRRSPLRIPGGQELEAQGGGDTGNEPIVVILGLADQMTPAPAGSVYSLRAASATTLTAAAWSNAVLTFADTLPAGRYAVVGATVQSATGVAFRLLIPGQYYRPGGLVITNLRQSPGAMFAKGGLGNWGEFDNDALPELEIFATGADTSAVLLLDVVKVR